VIVPGGRLVGCSAGSLTMPSNSARNHSSSSQINAQNRASTASELSAGPVFWLSRIASHPPP
jgi:hypothetical protein